MKKLTVFVFVFLVSCVTFAPVEDLTKKYVIDIPGMKKDKIYDKSLEWIALNFKSAKAVIELQDKGSGKIIGNISFKIVYTGAYSVAAPATVQGKITIEIKDNKARIILTALNTIFPGGERPITDFEYEPTIKELEKIRIRYTEYMTTTKKSEDW